MEFSGRISFKTRSGASVIITNMEGVHKDYPIEGKIYNDEQWRVAYWDSKGFLAGSDGNDEFDIDFEKSEIAD